MYTANVQARKLRNPNLYNLHEFLSRADVTRDCSRIVSLDFFDALYGPVAREIHCRDLQQELVSPKLSQAESRPDKPKRKGRILLIEDISSRAIEELGSGLDIDPYFFAWYVYRAWQGHDGPPRDGAINRTLPSRERRQNYLPLQYYRLTSSQHHDDGRLSLFLPNRNHQRKAVVLPAINGERIGLVQHCCSVLLMEQTEQEWLGKITELLNYRSTDLREAIILVDAPISSDYTPVVWDRSEPVNCYSRPFVGGCEDFLLYRGRSQRGYGSNAPSGRGMFNELIHYWTEELPPMFDVNKPTLQAFSYYPLKIVAAEWVNYTQVMNYSLRECELRTGEVANVLAEIEKLNENLRLLQRWRRWVLLARSKMERSIRFIEYGSESMDADEDWKALLQDYNYIKSEVMNRADRLEAMVPAVTSAVALIESRRSLVEATNVTRLTLLATVFVPLGYVSSLFSMSDGFRPGDPMFWIYFAVALPVTAVIVLIARPPSAKIEHDICKLLNRSFLTRADC